MSSVEDRLSSEPGSELVIFLFHISKVFSGFKYSSFVPLGLDGWADKYIGGFISL